MRSIGLCELLIELMMVRASERSAFGRTIIQYDTVQLWIAESRVELEQARLLATVARGGSTSPAITVQEFFHRRIGATSRC